MVLGVLLVLVILILAANIRIVPQAHAYILERQLERGEASGEFSKINAIMGEDIEESGDFIVNEKEKVVNLTEDGVKKVENFFHIENLADPENLEIQHLLTDFSSFLQRLTFVKGQREI